MSILNNKMLYYNSIICDTYILVSKQLITVLSNMSKQKYYSYIYNESRIISNLFNSHRTHTIHLSSILLMDC